MAELILKSHRFRTEREADWRRLEQLLAKAEGGSASRLSKEELLELPVLYRQALSSLSVARSISLDQSLIDYLESLSTRAYFFVYGARSTLLERMGRFFVHDWPRSVQGLWRETLVSFLIMILGAVAAAVLVTRNPDWFYAFVPRELSAGRDPSATAEFLRGTLYEDATKPQEGLSVFATFLFTHNAGVALFSFALGFALCLPTAALMLGNGLMLGAFLALYASHGLGVEAGGWLMIHGVTELFAITLAGAAGFTIGWAVVFPGELT
ncbi:MAG TPA: stage II sporulation protein M, partial [Phenylobacterium sp.]